MTDGPAGSGDPSAVLDAEGVYGQAVENLGEPTTWGLRRHDTLGPNETLFLVWGSRQFVVRAPPLADATHRPGSLAREYRVLDALWETDLRVPRTVFACEDTAVAGRPFYVYERLDGDVLRHGEPAQYATPTFRERVGTVLVDTLAEVHEADPGHVEDEGPALAERVTAVREWFAASRERTGRSLPAAEDLGEWLTSNVPEGERTLVHGDFSLENVLFSRSTPPSVVGVLDWEAAGLGDPLADLAWLATTWVDDVDAGWATRRTPRFTARNGYPLAAGLVGRYESQTGRHFEHQRFHLAFAAYRQAARAEAARAEAATGGGGAAERDGDADATAAALERAAAARAGDATL